MASNQAENNRDISSLALSLGFRVKYVHGARYKWVIGDHQQFPGEIGFKTKRAMVMYLIERKNGTISFNDMMGHLLAGKNFDI